MQDDVLLELKERYPESAGAPWVVHAPFRVCPLGAHVDHQLGVVTGTTITEGIWLAFVPNRTGQVRLVSMNFAEPEEFSLDDVPPARESDWGNYARGAVLALRDRGREVTCGIDAVIKGSLPPMGGLSSSAAMTIAYLLAFEQANGLEVETAENVELARYVENCYVGLNNGILDQSTILHGRKDALFWLDCQSRESSLAPRAPALPDFEVLIVYSGTTEPLVGTNYNAHVAECDEAAERLLAATGTKLAEQRPPKLRDVSRDDFERHQHLLPSNLQKRATHFFTENERVRQGIQAWQAGDLRTFGRLMTESGHSSVVNYECGRPELTTIWRIVKDLDGVYGTRFSGAGYRGCCIAFTNPEHHAPIEAMVTEQYLEAFPQYEDTFQIHWCGTADGAWVRRGGGVRL